MDWPTALSLRDRSPPGILRLEAHPPETPPGAAPGDKPSKTLLVQKCLRFLLVWKGSFVRHTVPAEGSLSLPSAGVTSRRLASTACSQRVSRPLPLHTLEELPEPWVWAWHPWTNLEARRGLRSPCLWLYCSVHPQTMAPHRHPFPFCCRASAPGSSGRWRQTDQDVPAVPPQPRRLPWRAARPAQHLPPSPTALPFGPKPQRNSPALLQPRVRTSLQAGGREANSALREHALLGPCRPPCYWGLAGEREACSRTAPPAACRVGAWTPGSPRATEGLCQLWATSLQSSSRDSHNACPVYHTPPNTAPVGFSRHTGCR